MKILELFSGIGGFCKGFTDADYLFSEHYFSEIDKNAIANYKYNFKNAKYIGDVREVNGRIYEGIDILTFGSPCQDFSIAGKRNGLDGNRSGLIREAIRIIKEAQPRVFIWENVKGTFSSNARRDFWAILQAFANIGNYHIEWQLLNTKWLLPQNRERIYLVGILGYEGSSIVFPFRENDNVFTKSKQSNGGQSQTKLCCTTINPKFGSRADDTFIQVGDFRYDDGFRPRKDGICPTLLDNSGRGMSGFPIISLKNVTRTGISDVRIGDGTDLAYLRHRNKRGRFHQGTAPTIDTSNNQGVVLGENLIRKLTEIECERLQGFPDDWTKFGDFENQIKEIPKTQRYKMIGNAVTTALVKEIANRLKPILL
ncbi:DNA cytosine methyltransferase [Capnocytophaga canis]|uniref:DNA cytosine methyltransferase n=1 Tax=Capnocytophaga canis TaxID=1848903 RepID=UPI0015629139|nr:DNA (cytosine-5-)-methyltransferase [Capnocytophaga canis]